MGNVSISPSDPKNWYMIIGYIRPASARWEGVSEDEALHSVLPFTLIKVRNATNSLPLELHIWRVASRMMPRFLKKIDPCTVCCVASLSCSIVLKSRATQCATRCFRLIPPSNPPWWHDIWIRPNQIIQNMCLCVRVCVYVCVWMSVCLWERSVLHLSYTIIIFFYCCYSEFPLSAHQSIEYWPMYVICTSTQLMCTSTTCDSSLCSARAQRCTTGTAQQYSMHGVWIARMKCKHDSTFRFRYITGGTHVALRPRSRRGRLKLGTLDPKRIALNFTRSAIIILMLMTACGFQALGGRSVSFSAWTALCGTNR